MQIHLDDATTTYRIQRYEPKKITINDVIYNHNLILSTEKIWADRYISHKANSADEETLTYFIDLKPQIFLFGTGETQQFLSPWLQALFYSHRIGVEAMSTAAACRTYNVLLAEGRYVMASLLV
ncbi:MAG: hypothetical protein K0R48_221 [Gammaproteobacteria bacterium]|jgi:uncharacterized protein|nr:hypothetical protein [Gammaproteobacteria bacterium]